MSRDFGALELDFFMYSNIWDALNLLIQSVKMISGPPDVDETESNGSDTVDVTSYGVCAASR